MAYGNQRFNTQGSFIVPALIDFQNTDIAIEVEGIQLNDALTIDKLKESYADEAAYANIKEGSGSVKLSPKADNSYYELTFEADKLKSVKRRFDCK